MDTRKLRRKLDALKGEHSLLTRQCAEESASLKEAEEQLSHVLTAQALVQAAAEEVQANAHRQIASVVTRCLQAVFGPDAYTFRIDFSRKRGKTEAKLLFERGGRTVDPMTASGGGPKDVAAFALRLACLLLSTPRRRRVVIADEPFHFLHGEHYRERLRAMIETLSEEMKVQFIIVTQDDDLAMGKVVRL